MGFYYAREKQKFDAEWERLSAWYQAEGMSAEAIEAIRQFDWANFCHQRVYEHWTTAFPEDTYVEDSKVCTLLRCCASMAETDEVSQMLRSSSVISLYGARTSFNFWIFSVVVRFGLSFMLFFISR